ncbi:MAG: hypothetical protein OXG10_08965 [Candidatus Dadabacteria bacterium]|nr:hypothetical protein [Candidatus Dadabacteria bacterium]
MVKSKRQAFIDFCKIFFNQSDIDERVLENVKIEDGKSYTYTFTITITKEFIRESNPEVFKSLEDFRRAQAYSLTGEAGEPKVHM